jgi:hypothetical protein
MSQHQPVAPAPKKSTTKKALVIVGGVFGALIVIGGVGAALGGGDTTTADPGAATSSAPAATTSVAPKPAAKTTETKPAENPAEPKTEKPADANKVTVAVGKAFTVGDDSLFSGKYTVQAGWKLGSEYGVPTITARVKNAGDDKAAIPNLQIKFLNGSDVVMSFTCTANELEPGQTAKLNCFSSDDFSRKYKTVVAETGL